MQSQTQKKYQIDLKSFVCEKLGASKVIAKIKRALSVSLLFREYNSVLRSLIICDLSRINWLIYCMSQSYHISHRLSAELFIIGSSKADRQIGRQI